MHSQMSQTCRGGLINRPHAQSNVPRPAHRCTPAFRRARLQPQAQRHVAAATATEQLPELTKKLRDVIQTNGASTKFPPDALPVLEEIDSIVQDNGVPEITAEGIRGRFRQVLNNTNFVDAEGTLTLGVLTFNQFGPKDLKVELQGVELLQGVESPDQYSTEATFKILGGELDGVEGIQKTLGHYEVTGEKQGRQDVYFSGVAIFPKKSEDSERWVAAMKEHNSTMDDNGRAEIQFPGSAAHGFRDFRIIEDDLTLTVGNRKSFVCVQPA
jgi:hypothetical protein